MQILSQGLMLYLKQLAGLYSFTGGGACFSTRRLIGNEGDSVSRTARADALPPHAQGILWRASHGFRLSLLFDRIVHRFDRIVWLPYRLTH